MTRVLQKEIKNTNLNIKIKLIEPGAYHTGFNQIMIENKEKLNNDIFNEPIEKIVEKQKKIFSIIEKKSIKSIVNKMYYAITSNDNKLVYRAPFIQAIGIKIYILFSK